MSPVPLGRALAPALACLALAVATTAPARAAGDAPLTPLATATHDTAFYRVLDSGFQVDDGAVWVTHWRGEQVLAVGADRDLRADVPYFGGYALAYPVTLVDFPASTQRPLGTIDLSGLVPAGSRLRLLDLQAFPELQAKGSGSAQVLVSFATSNAEGDCRRVVVAPVAVDTTGAKPPATGRPWFAMPCVRPQAQPDRGVSGPILHQSGGRLALVPRRDWAKPAIPEILVTTGDFQVLRTQAAQVPPSTRRLMSAVIRVPRGGKPTVVARGLRNPQGLAAVSLDRVPALLATSHGSRGGDLLARIEPGADFGWPRASLGTAYEASVGAGPQHSPIVSGALPRLTQPAFAWTPSIGPSSVMQVRGPAFRRWWEAGNGRTTSDLLVSGMADRAIERLTWADGAVRSVERIPVGTRVRSMTQTASGAIVLGTDEGRLQVLVPQATWNPTSRSYAQP